MQEELTNFNCLKSRNVGKLEISLQDKHQVCFEFDQVSYWLPKIKKECCHDHLNLEYQARHQ